MCQDGGVPVTSLPGAAACITALTLSGLSTRRFCFEGFLPSDKKEKREVLEELARETRTIVLYEAPHVLPVKAGIHLTFAHASVPGHLLHGLLVLHTPLPVKIHVFLWPWTISSS